MSVCVVAPDKKPLMPTSEYRARKLLKNGKAVIFKHKPFTIMLTRIVKNTSILTANLTCFRMRRSGTMTVGKCAAQEETGFATESPVLIIGQLPKRKDGWRRR